MGNRAGLYLGLSFLGLMTAVGCSDEDAPSHALATSQIMEFLRTEDGLTARVVSVEYINGAPGESDTYMVETQVTETQISCAEAKAKYLADKTLFTPDGHALARFADATCDQRHTLYSDTLPVRAVGEKLEYDYNASFRKTDTGWVLQPESLVSSHAPNSLAPEK